MSPVMRVARVVTIVRPIRTDRVILLGTAARVDLDLTVVRGRWEQSDCADLAIVGTGRAGGTRNHVECYGCRDRIIETFGAVPGCEGLNNRRNHPNHADHPGSEGCEGLRLDFVLSALIPGVYVNGEVGWICSPSHFETRRKSLPAKDLLMGRKISEIGISSPSESTGRLILRRIPLQWRPELPFWQTCSHFDYTNMGRKRIFSPLLPFKNPLFYRLEK